MRHLLFALVVLVMYLPCFAHADKTESARPIVGAIRWDAWFPGGHYQKFLGPGKWHYRLPFYGKVINADETLVCSNTQDVMDQEIGYASKAGLDYWAFDYYVPGSFAVAESYNYGVTLYLSSKHRNDLNFCLILLGQQLGPKDKWAENAAQIVRLFKVPTYQRVCGGRPLVFVYSLETLEPKFGSLAEACKVFDELRRQSVKAGAGEPYFVAQTWWPPLDVRYCDALGFEGISAYAVGESGEHKERPYSDLVKVNRQFWDRCKSTGKQVIPLVSTGWDGRPLMTSESDGKHYKGMAYYSPAKPSEIADNLRSALDWAKANPKATKPNAILIYAWNESAEGGWLVPTLSEGTARLDAIGDVLKRANACYTSR